MSIRLVFMSLVLAAWIVVSSTLWGCAAGESLERFEFTRVSMGVPAKILLYAKNRQEASAAAASAFDRIAQLDDTMSDYRARSELMRVCENSRSDPTLTIPVSADLARVLEVAREISEASNGAFDVTVGPVVRLWREARRSGVMPSEAARAEALTRVDWRSVEVDAANRMVRLRRAGTQLDLGGIGKGYAAQAAVETLMESGHGRCMVAMAGDIVAGDAPPGKGGWRIELPAEVTLAAARARGDPRSGRVSSVRAIELAHAAVSTSGDSEQSVEIAGLRYSHIVDPRTGLGVTKRVMCTVVASRGEIADAVASAVCVMNEAELADLQERVTEIGMVVWNLGAAPSRASIWDPGDRLRLIRAFEPTLTEPAMDR